MYPLSERVLRLRERAINWQETQNEMIGQRLYPALKGLAECAPGMPWMKRKAKMLSAIILQSEPIVYPDELLVGYNFGGGDEQQSLEMTLSRPNEAQRDRLRAYLGHGLLTEAQIDEALSILEDVGSMVPGVGFVPERPDLIGRAAEEGLFWCHGTAYNHTVIGYARVLESGFGALADEARQRLSSLTVVSADDWQAQMVLESMLTVAESAAELGQRYAARVRLQRDRCADPVRAAELARLQQVLEHVPAKPAQSFHEALQSLWFAHAINTWEDGINANSLGRLDQILYPYYARDIDEGRLTREGAFELLCCLWIKLYRDYDVQQVAIGGVDAEGRDAANELTYLMLDVTEALGFVRCLSVRLHRQSPPALLRRSLELVSKGNGIPFFFNDEVIVPALVDNGIALADARDYAAIGCVEITIPGKANPHAVSSRINLLKCLELTLNNGQSMTTGWQLGPETGMVSEMTCLDDVIAAYERQVSFYADQMCQETVRLGMAHRLIAPMPYKSLLTEGCLASGRDFNDRGATYDYHESMPMGIPNVADSLAAIDRLVFTEGRFTLSELVEQMRRDFPDEAVRQALLHAPKYGNDEDGVDGLASTVFRHYCELMRHLSKSYELPFFAQPFTFLWLVDAGQRTAATPDGRRRGDNLAYSISPMQGRDFRGLTAVINSLAKLPQHMAAGCTSAIVEAEPVLFAPEHIDHLVTLCKIAVDKGVGQLQFNVVSAETLRKAQAEPEKYRNLAVRVSGFSQRFCLLSQEIQEHIIARTKHGRV